jgi:hypothetical protein
MELRQKIYGIKKGDLIGNDKIEHIVPYKVWYNKLTKQLQGQQPYFLVIADPDKKLPDIISKPKEIEERNVLLLVLENKK